MCYVEQIKEDGAMEVQGALERGEVYIKFWSQPLKEKATW